MSSTVMVIAAILLVGILYCGFKLTSRTARELVIPLAGSDPSADEIKAVLERMGCLVAEDRTITVTGFLPGDGLHWGQEVTVTVERGQLHVRSSFSGSQAFGASKNQENVERFEAEWRRAPFRGAATPTELAVSEARAREVARRSLRAGSLWIGAGAGLFALALVAKEGVYARADGRLMVPAFALLAYGVPRTWAAIARLRKKPRRP